MDDSCPCKKELIWSAMITKQLLQEKEDRGQRVHCLEAFGFSWTLGPGSLAPSPEPCDKPKQLKHHNLP